MIFISGDQSRSAFSNNSADFPLLVPNLAMEIRRDITTDRLLVRSSELILGSPRKTFFLIHGFLVAIVVELNSINPFVDSQQSIQNRMQRAVQSWGRGRTMLLFFHVVEDHVIIMMDQSFYN